MHRNIKHIHLNALIDTLPILASGNLRAFSDFAALYVQPTISFMYQGNIYQGNMAYIS
jgi:hypothetical protein